MNAVLDEYFLEFKIFERPFRGKATMHLSKVYPNLKYIWAR